MTRLLRGLVWASVTTAVVGFFLPWARLRLREPLIGGARRLERITVTVRQGDRTISGALPSLEEIPTRVSGWQIPRLANQPHAQLALALLELATNTHQHIGLKSYAVYLVPGMALLCGLLLTAWGHRMGVAVGTALWCAGMAAVGFWKLSTLTARSPVAAIVIGHGLWMSVWAYVGLAVIAGLLGLLGRRANA